MRLLGLRHQTHKPSCELRAAAQEIVDVFKDARSLKPSMVDAALERLAAALGENQP